jgi:hypothetical protein
MDGSATLAVSLSGNIEDLVLEEEHTASRRKFKNFGFNPDEYDVGGGGGLKTFEQYNKESKT